MMKSQRRTITRAGLSLMMAVCLLLSLIAPAGAATVSVGSTASSLTPSATKVYIQLSRSVLFFTGDLYGTGSTVTPTIGSVCQLVTNDFYTASDGLSYFGVYYMSQRYNVLRTDVLNDIMSASALETYITGTLWKQTTYTTLKAPMNLVGDVRVHGLQLALQKLGYYTDKLDGNYGDNTTAAVKKFQNANGLHADGAAGVLTQPVIYALASGGTVTPGGSSSGGSSSGSSGSSSGSSSSISGTLKTKVSVNLRKSTSTSSARLAVLPKGLNLAYIGTAVKNGVTWYNVRYNSITGWVMGTYVTASGSSSGGSSGSSTTPIGTVTITKPSTRVRKTPGGTKTGTVLAKGTVVNLLAQGVQSGGYTWYRIRTSSGLVGYVRGDCANVNSNGGSTNPDVPGSTEKTFVRLPANTVLFTTKTKPSSGGYTVSAGTVLQMVTTATYTEGGVEYCTLYYNNQQYNAVYADVKGGVMTSSDLSAYVQVLWNSSLGSSLKRELNLVGDIRVYALQAALNKLGYYTGKLDGTYGTETQSAVRNFQRKAGISVDGACGTATWAKLQAQLGTSGGGGSSGGGSIEVTDFGTVNSVQKASWNYDDNGGALFPKSTYATVMDVQTGKVFRIYRWSGGNHADCVPATVNDTRTMCDIVGFPYNSSRPTSDQLAKIKADGNASTVTYTWPDFKNSFGGGKNIGGAWDRRPALLNVDGKVYAVSIYGFPHGFNGTDSFSNSKFSDNGQYFYANNNYYGMMCVHFVGSKTHSGTSPDSKHQAAIDEAYNYAKKLWPTLCK